MVKQVQEHVGNVKGTHNKLVEVNRTLASTQDTTVAALIQATDLIQNLLPTSHPNRVKASQMCEVSEYFKERLVKLKLTPSNEPDGKEEDEEPEEEEEDPDHSSASNHDKDEEGRNSDGDHGDDSHSPDGNNGGTPKGPEPHDDQDQGSNGGRSTSNTTREEHGQDHEGGKPNANKSQEKQNISRSSPINWQDTSSEEDDNVHVKGKTTTPLSYGNNDVGLVPNDAHETLSIAKEASVDGVEKGRKTDGNNQTPNDSRKPGHEAVTTQITTYGEQEKQNGDAEVCDDTDGVQFIKVVRPKIHTEPNILTPQELARILGSMFKGDTQGFKRLIRKMRKNMPKAVLKNEQIKSIIASYFDSDYQQFEEVWYETIIFLNKAMRGEGLILGGKPMDEPDSSSTSTIPPSLPTPPANLGSLLERIVDTHTFNQIIKLPRDQQPIATIMAYCKYLGYPFDTTVPKPEDYEEQFEEGTAEYRQSKLQRLSEIRQMSLTLAQQVKNTLEKHEKGGAVARSSYISPPPLDGSKPFFDFRTYGAKVEDFMKATRLPIEAVMTHLINHTIDEPTRQWLTTLQAGGSIEDMEDLKRALDAKFNHGRVFDSHINSLIQRFETEENETLLDSSNRFHRYLTSSQRPYLSRTPAPGTEADVLEEQDCTSFLNGQVPEDHEKIRQTMNVYQVTRPDLSRYHRMVEATRALASNKQSILGCPYVPRPTKMKGKKSLIPDASTALPTPINAVETSTVSPDQAAIDDAVTKAINALISKFDHKLNRLDKHLSKNFNKNDDKGKSSKNKNDGEDRYSSYRHADYIDQADVENIRKQQMDPAKHYPYYRLLVKETKARLCTLCAGEHSFMQCPKSSILAPYRQMAIDKIKEARAEKRKRGSVN